MSEPTAPPPAAPPIASVVSWLGMLFVTVLALVVVGGFVRLSGSGLSIPGWPVISIDESRWTLLPPVADADWIKLREHFEADQERLRQDIQRGAVGIGSLGRVPHDLASFKTMFLIEWSHRFVAAIAGLIAAGCLAVVLRHRGLRSRVGWLFGSTCLLIVFQALLGGALVKSGTATHWLFLHLGTAAVILACTVWTILRLLHQGDPRSMPRPVGRGGLIVFTRLALLVTWLQIVLGALVAGSRGDTTSNTQFVSSWPKIAGQWIPYFLWDDQRPLAWNLLDNAVLHQWVHRWFAMVVLIVVGGLCWVAIRRRDGGLRMQLAARVTGTFLAMQVVLGMANVFLTHPTFVALAHLVMGMFLLASLVLLAFDAASVPVLGSANPGGDAPGTPDGPAPAKDMALA